MDIGANAKMNEFCAIMGICNLKRVNEVYQMRKVRFEYYLDRLHAIKGIHFFVQRAEATMNYAYVVIIVGDEFGISRDELYLRLRSKNIFPRKYFYPLTSDQACFKNKYKNADLPIARDLANRVLTLPMYEDISFEDIDRIVNVIESTGEIEDDKNSKY